MEDTDKIRNVVSSLLSSYSPLFLFLLLVPRSRTTTSLQLFTAFCRRPRRRRHHHREEEYKDKETRPPLRRKTQRCCTHHRLINTPSSSSQKRFPPETLSLSLFRFVVVVFFSDRGIKGNGAETKSCSKSCTHRFSACVLGVFLVRSFLQKNLPLRHARRRKR